jgi:hypothetical protein
MTKSLKQVCKCVNCGNEAEMELTCSLPEYEKAAEKVKKAAEKKEKVHSKVKATGICTHCGNEADMWIDI